MWSAEFEAVKKIMAKYGIKPGQLKAIEVGGGPIVVVDNKSQPNPVLTISPNVVFFDKGFLPGRRTENRVIIGDFCQPDKVLPLSGSFDIVYSFSTLEHVVDPWSFAKHMVTVAKPGGWIFLTTVFSFPYHPSPEDHWRFSPTGLRILFQEAHIIWSGWGPNHGGVMLFAQREPSPLDACLSMDLEEFYAT